MSFRGLGVPFLVVDYEHFKCNKPEVKMNHVYLASGFLSILDIQNFKCLFSSLLHEIKDMYVLLK